MATTYKGEMRGRKSKWTLTDDGVEITTTRRYVVISDILNESEYAVITTTGLPIIGFSTLTDGSVCKSLDPEQDPKQPRVWFVNAEFTAKPVGQDTKDGDGNHQPDPTTWYPIYRGTIETFSKVMLKDTAGTPYMNTAKDRFPNPLIRQVPLIVYEFDQYENASLTDYQIAQRNDYINAGTFKTFPSQTLKANVKGFERGYYFGYSCTKVSYKITFNPDFWTDKPLNIGYEYFVSAGGEKAVSPKLVNLNSDGTKKADNTDPDELEFFPYDNQDFSAWFRVR